MYTYMYTYIRTYIHIYTYTHIYILLFFGGGRWGGGRGELIYEWKKTFRHSSLYYSMKNKLLKFHVWMKY